MPPVRTPEIKYLQQGLIRRVLAETGHLDIKSLLEHFVRQGYGPWQISGTLEVDYRTVHRWAKSAGVELLKHCSKDMMLPREVSPQAIARSVEATTRWIEWRGERISLKDAASRLGISRRALAYRLDNWKDIDRAMTEKPIPAAKRRHPR